MNEIFVTATGFVATVPKKKVVDDSLQLFSFRFGSTIRRFDSGSGGWIDGPTSWMTVSCWRSLAANAGQCVVKGDRLLVHGRLKIKEWTTPEGERRTSVEVIADSIAHDLTFGTAVFKRTHRVQVVEDTVLAEAEALTRSVELEAYDEPDDEFDESLENVPHGYRADEEEDTRPLVLSHSSTG